MAAILRCLATAERLPPLNYSSVCRRALREHGGLAATASVQVEQAAVRFAAMQGSRRQQEHHLADLTAHLLSPSGLAASSLPLQEALLAQLPSLLASLPETQAVAVLGDACLHVVTSAGGHQLQLPLMQAMERLLAGGDVDRPILQQAALQLLTDQLFTQLPAPGMYPLRLSALLHPVPSAEQAPRPLSSRQRLWAAALRCLRLVPQERLFTFLQSQLHHVPLQAAFATATLVASGSLQAEALQHPRNLLLVAGGGGLSWQQQGFIAVFLGRAVATQPANQQQKWLLDALDACKVLGQREAACGAQRSA